MLINNLLAKTIVFTRSSRTPINKNIPFTLSRIEIHALTKDIL